MEHYSVTGMSCAACSSRVEKAVSKVDGVTECTVSLLTNSMTVEGTAAPETIIQAVKDAGPNACPPMVVGVGLGGSFEKAAFLAKKALTRNLDTPSEKPHIAKLEKELLEEINQLGIGPGGLGGSTTALGLNIETYPTHIAGMPLAVNICCHVNRHAHRVL